jgi:hypothetical protein
MTELSEPLVTPVTESFDAETIAGERYALHPRVRALWRMRAIGIALFTIAVPGIPVGVLVGGWQGFVAAFALAALVLFALERYHAAYHRGFRCVLLPDGLLLARGVVFHSETFVPRARIQHTDVDQGPIARRYGIAKLKVYTAGSTVGELEVAGLPREAAIALRDRLLGREGDDAL